MSTPAQIDANRRNAILSTGPRSEAGKAAVSGNAQSHGLSGTSPLLAYEDRSAFEALVGALLSEFDPQTEHESFLVQQMIEARWRLARLRRIEAATFEALLGESPATPDARIAQALLLKNGDALSKLERYASTAERSYYKAHQELQASIKSRVAEKAAAQSKCDDNLLELILRPPVCKTNPIPESLDDEELERLTRPPITRSAPPRSQSAVAR